MTAPAPVRLAHPWALGIGLVLLLPQLVIAVVVVRNPLVVGFAGFAMTIGFVRLAALGYRVLRERRPRLGLGVLFLLGAVGTVVGSALYAQVARAAVLAGDVRYSAVLAPPAAIGLNLVVILSLGLWVTGVVLAVASIGGAIGAARRRR